jgi:ABC-type nitrate/sulfonate/bicarbonate transport system permease component
MRFAATLAGVVLSGVLGAACGYNCGYLAGYDNGFDKGNAGMTAFMRSLPPAAPLGPLPDFRLGESDMSQASP